MGVPPPPGVYHYNADLSDLLDKHAPERTHAVTLQPHSPWFNDSLRKLKTEKRRLERQWMKSGLEIHKQIFIKHINRMTFPFLIDRSEPGKQFPHTRYCDVGIHDFVESRIQEQLHTIEKAQITTF